MKALVMMAATLIASPASANWQYSTWGMKPAELIQASKGEARIGPGERSSQTGDTRDAVGTYSAGSYRFESSFWFGASGLSRVTLNLNNDQECTSLRRDLLGQYGEPVEVTGTSVQRRTWLDKSKGNVVVLIETGLSYCELQYAPARKAAQGL